LLLLRLNKLTAISLTTDVMHLLLIAEIPGPQCVQCAGKT